MKNMHSLTFCKLRHLHLLYSTFRYSALFQKYISYKISPLNKYNSTVISCSSKKYKKEIEDLDLDVISNLFPNPRNAFKNFYSLSSQNLKQSYEYNINFEKMGQDHDPKYTCMLSLKGPIYEEFIGVSHSKKSAEAGAMAKALFKLYRGRFMDTKGVPKEIRMSGCKTEIPRKVLEALLIDVPISLSHESLIQAESLINTFHEEIASSVRGIESEIEEKQGTQNILSFMTGKIITGIQEQETERDDQLLVNLHRGNWIMNGQSYPIENLREEIMACIQANPVTIIEGGTGCGKSSQVPQMILDHWIKEGCGSLCNVLVAQPRRIATLSLCNWVAKERKQKVGMSVGYKMRLDEVLLRENGGIMFYTSGSLREMVRCNPNFDGVSHVIVDEVHERSIDTDLLLLLAKRAILRGTNVKFILMSATAQIEDFMNYFNTKSVVRIPLEKRFPISTFHLENIVNDLYSSVQKREKTLENSKKENRFPSVKNGLIVDIVRFIHENKPDGAVLIFLPGWSDIKTLEKFLKDIPDLWIVPLHSRLTKESQNRIFERGPLGSRKIILATNIAETSLTVDDVVYVVDSGLQNDSRFVPNKNISTFGTVWITKGNAIQRGGRAGRVAPGEVYRLYSKQTFEAMTDFPKGEMLKLPLESVVLRCKSLFEGEPVRAILEELIEMPSPMAVEKAIDTLVHLRVLRAEGGMEGNEVLTALGRSLVRVSTSPVFGKALVYSAFLGCFDAVSTFVAVENRSSGIFADEITNERTRALKSWMEFPYSDLLASCELINRAIKLLPLIEADKYFVDSDEESATYSDTQFKLDSFDDHVVQSLSKYSCPERLNNVIQIRNLFRRQIADLLPSFISKKPPNRMELPISFSEISDFNYYSEFGDTERQHSDEESEQNVMTENGENSCSSCHELVLASFLSSTTSIFKRLVPQNTSGKSLISENGSRVLTHNSSVLHNLIGEEEHHYFSTDVFHSQARNISVARDLSSIPAISVLLFFGENLEVIPLMNCNGGKYQIGIKGHNTLRFVTDERTANCILELRQIWCDMLEYFLEARLSLHGETSTNIEIEDRTFKYCLDLNDFINRLLTDQRIK